MLRPALTLPSLARSALLRRPAAVAQLRHGSHGPVYDPPSGWLWAIPPGEKQKTEGWEWIWYTFVFGGSALGAVGYYFKPDTS